MTKRADGDWITPAEAARIRGVSRQAIARLIRRGRFNTTEFGGRTFLNRREVEQFRALRRGRKATS